MQGPGQCPVRGPSSRWLPIPGEARPQPLPVRRTQPHQHLVANSSPAETNGVPFAWAVASRRSLNGQGAGHRFFAAGPAAPREGGSRSPAALPPPPQLGSKSIEGQVIGFSGPDGSPVPRRAITKDGSHEAHFMNDPGHRILPAQETPDLTQCVSPSNGNYLLLREVETWEL